MNTNPYSYDQILCIIDLCVGLERHTRLNPDSQMMEKLGQGIVSRILEMRHGERINFIQEVAGML